MSNITSPSTLIEQVDYNGTNFGNLTWLISPESGSTVSYASARNKIVAIANHLRGKDLPPGSKIAVAANNGIGSCLTILGIIYAGHIALPLNLVAGAKIIAYTINHSETALIFTADECKPLISEALYDCENEIDIISLDPEFGPLWTEEIPEEPFEPLTNIATEEVAVIMYTSGTTGNPKGVMLSHSNLLAAGRYISSGHDVEHKDVALCVLPIYHINGLCVTVMGTLASASTLVIPHRFSVSAFWRLIETHRCSWFSAVPTQYSYILHNKDMPGTISCLRFARSASAPLSPEIHRKFEERFKVPIIETMGLTETGSQISTNPLPPQTRKIGSPGKAYGNKLMIGNNVGDEMERGITGEILVKGDNVMKGYFKQPDETANTINENGWLKTGDLGYMDEDGYIFVTGRIKELIIKGGENIAPREIDEALLDHESVLEAAAFAVPCDNYGERVEACVIPREGIKLNLKSIEEHCIKNIGKFKSPDKIHVMKDLPKGPSGKIQRLKLYNLVYPKSKI